MTTTRTRLVPSRLLLELISNAGMLGLGRVQTLDLPYSPVNQTNIWKKPGSGGSESKGHNENHYLAAVK